MGVRSKEANKLYMREYRAAGRDKHKRIRIRAEGKALKWLRENYPDVWRTMYDDAWYELFPDHFKEQQPKRIHNGRID